MGTAVVVSANTKQLLERAVAKLDVLGHIKRRRGIFRNPSLSA